MPTYMPGFTPSAFPRLARCLGAMVLPTAEELVSSMRRGTAMHRYLERIAGGMTPAESLALVEAEWLEDCRAVDLGGLPPLASGLAEVGLLLDVDAGTARVVGAGATREQVRAAATPSEVPMLADWLAQQGAGGVLLDWKTGRQEELAPARDNLQVRTYAAAALLAFGWDSVRYGLIRVDGDKPRWDTAEMDWLGAQDALAEVRALRDAARAAVEAHRVDGTLPKLRLGPWCDWCPAARQCPARVRAVLAVLDGSAGRAVAEALTPEQAGEVYSRLLAAKDAVETMLSDLKALAKQTPLPLPSGKVLAAVEKSSASPDVEAAKAVLARTYGEDVARAALVYREPSMSWDSVRAALEAHALPERQQAWEDNRGGKRGRKPSAGTLATEARKLLENAGAVKRSAWLEVREVGPDSPALMTAGTPGEEG